MGANLPVIVNIVSGCFSLFLMVYATLKERHGKVLYILAGILCAYYSVVYTYILISQVQPNINTALLVRTPLSLLLLIPGIIYLARDTWTPHS